MPILLLAGVVALSGCTNPVTQQTLSFEATPAGVEQSALSSTGYSTYSSGWENVSRNVTAAGQQRTVNLANYVAEYRRPLGNGTEGGFGVLATPQASFAGQTLNPISGWSDQQLIQEIPNPYGSVSNLQQRGTRTVTMLGQQTQVSMFSGTGSSGTDVMVHLARVNDKGDIVVAGAVHSTQFNETSRVNQLFENVRHPLEEGEGTGGTGEQPQGEVQTVSIEELNENPEEFMGQRVRVKGYYSSTGSGLLASDYRNVITDKAMPRNSYVPLMTGEQDELSNENEGYTVEVEGVVNEYAPNTQFEEAQDNEKGASVWSPHVQLNVRQVNIIELEDRISLYIPQIPEDFITPEPQLERSDCRFAVIMSGGINQANNHKRYWNDVVYTYKAMNGAFSIPDDQIYVNYWNGTPDEMINGRNIVD
ncbi:MAG: DUF6517 family protein, partial [Halobacteria archaeon]|nr:DUF6517 family protein [Halobacteria archaeon]